MNVMVVGTGLLLSLTQVVSFDGSTLAAALVTEKQQHQQHHDFQLRSDQERRIRLRQTNHLLRRSVFPRLKSSCCDTPTRTTPDAPQQLVATDVPPGMQPTDRPIL